MKRSRVEEIMFGVFQRAGCEVTCDVGKTIADGLRQIRRERHEEHIAKKESYKEQKRNYYYWKLRSGRHPKADGERGRRHYPPEGLTDKEQGSAADCDNT